MTAQTDLTVDISAGTITAPDWDQDHEGAYRHIADAVRINLTRGRIYSTMTGGKSILVTFLLVFSEISILLPGLFFDWWGRRFNREGIPVIAADFVSMSRINNIDQPLRYAAHAEKKHWGQLRGHRKSYEVRMSRAVRDTDFHRAAQLTYDLLKQVHRLELESQSLMPMNRHLLESIGIAALNAIYYGAQSAGRTDFLCKQFLKLQFSGIGLAATFDRFAQSSHVMGAGIIENDVPYIPFEEKWELYCATNRSRHGAPGYLLC